MNDGLKKFRELLLTDMEFQGKLKAAVESYTGEQTEESVFNNVLIPLAAEYGITATFDEFKTYMESIGGEEAELNTDEIAQVAGGDSKGYGAEVCVGVGVGIGVTGDSNQGSGNVCLGVGIGNGKGQACTGEGISSP